MRSRLNSTAIRRGAVNKIEGMLVMAAFALLTGWGLFKGLRTGFMVMYQPTFRMTGRRRDQPVRFWSIAALLMFLCAASVIVTIALGLELMRRP